LSRETYGEIGEFREEDFLPDLPDLLVKEFREEDSQISLICL